MIAPVLTGGVVRVTEMVERQKPWLTEQLLFVGGGHAMSR